jgi:hypothetical protein
MTSLLPSPGIKNTVNQYAVFILTTHPLNNYFTTPPGRIKPFTNLKKITIKISGDGAEGRRKISSERAEGPAFAKRNRGRILLLPVA